MKTQEELEVEVKDLQDWIKEGKLPPSKRGDANLIVGVLKWVLEDDKGKDVDGRRLPFRRTG